MEFQNINDAIAHGFSVEKSFNGPYRLMYGNHLVFEDPANEDMTDYDNAVCYMIEPAQRYYNNIAQYVSAVADLGAGATCVEDIDMAEVVAELADKFGYTDHESGDTFEQACDQLELDPAKVKKIRWIGANVCACVCLFADYE